MWNLKYDTTELIYKTERDSEAQRADLWLPRGRAKEGVEWESVNSICKLLHTDWINNKVLLYSTGNYTQNPVINHNGEEYKKNLSMCVTE